MIPLNSGVQRWQHLTPMLVFGSYPNLGLWLKTRAKLTNELSLEMIFVHLISNNSLEIPLRRISFPALLPAECDLAAHLLLSAPHPPLLPGQPVHLVCCLPPQHGCHHSANNYKTAVIVAINITLCVSL